MERPTIHKACRYFTAFCAGGASSSMMAVFAIILFNSLRRYLFGKSLAWGEELPNYLAIYGFMFGAAYAYMQDRHIRFTILLAFLPKRFTGRLYMLLDLVMVGIGGLMAWSGWQFVARRGGMEASGLITMVKDLRDATGLGWMIWFGHLYTYQAAMVLGGILLSAASVLKFLERGTEGAWAAASDRPETRPVEG